MRRVFLVLLVIVGGLVLPANADADVTFASLNSTDYAGPIGSVLQVTATFEGNTVNYGAKHPMILVPVEFSPQASSTCRAQKRFISNTSQVEFTACEVTSTRFDDGRLAVVPSLPAVGSYDEYLIEMTLQLLVTSLASPGDTYTLTVPDTLSSYPNYMPPLTASLHVLADPQGPNPAGAVSIDNFETTVQGGQTLTFAIPYDPPKGTTAVDVSLYTGTGTFDTSVWSFVSPSFAVCGLGQGTGLPGSAERTRAYDVRPLAFQLSLPRWLTDGEMIRVCAQVIYLQDGQEIGRQNFASRLWVAPAEENDLP